MTSDHHDGRPGALGLGRVLRLGWPLIVLLTLVAGAAGLFASSSRTPEYEASARLLVTPLAQYDETFLGTALFRDTGDPTTTALTAAELFRSNAIAERAARRLGGEWTRESLLEAVEVRQVPDTRVLEVAARSDDPEEAARAATVFAQTIVVEREREAGGQLRGRLRELRERRERVDPDDYSRRDNLDEEIRLIENALQNGGDPTLALSQEAAPPTAGALTPAWLIVGAALAGGLVLGVLAAFGLAWLTRRVQGGSEVTSLLPLPVVARVPRVRGARGGDPIAPDALPPGADAAFEALALRLLRERADGGTVVVTSAGRGDGRTTTVAALARALAELGERVTIVDLDVESDAVGRLLTDGPYPPSLRLAPPARRETLLEDRIGAHREDGGWVLIDTPPVASDAIALRAAPFADEILVVVRIGHTHGDDLSRMRALLERAGGPIARLVLVAVGRRDAGPDRLTVPPPAARKRRRGDDRTAVRSRDPVAGGTPAVHGVDEL